MSLGGADGFGTARILGRPIAADQLDDLTQLHLDAEVSRFLGGVRTPEQTAEYLDAQIRHWNDHGFGLWTLHDREDGRFLGRAGVRFTELDGAPVLEIAYTLARAAWGKGLATEVASGLVDYWRTRMSHPLLVGIVDVGNHASANVLLKAGFTRVRQTRFHEFEVDVFELARA